MIMPILKPLPIPTKNRQFFIRIFLWIFYIRKWEVIEDWTYTLRDGTKIIIEKGFIFDGASIPRPLWMLLSPTGLLFIPGLIHDYGYRHNKLLSSDKDGNINDYKNGAGKAYWDKIFFEISIDVNGMAFIDMLAWVALGLCGWYTWLKHRRKDKNNPSKSYGYLR